LAQAKGESHITNVVSDTKYTANRLIIENRETEGLGSKSYSEHSEEYKVYYPKRNSLKLYSISILLSDTRTTCQVST